MATELSPKPKNRYSVRHVHSGSVDYISGDYLDVCKEHHVVTIHDGVDVVFVAALCNVNVKLDNHTSDK